MANGFKGQEHNEQLKIENPIQHSALQNMRKKVYFVKEFWRRERVWILVCVSLSSSWINIGCELVSVLNEKFPFSSYTRVKKSKKFLSTDVFRNNIAPKLRQQHISLAFWLARVDGREIVINCRFVVKFLENILKWQEICFYIWMLNWSRG